MRVLHCSDLHVTQRYREAPFHRLGWRRWVAMAELTVGGRAAAYRDAGATVERIVAARAAHGADRLIVSGDLTGYATDAEFAAARAALGGAGASRATCAVVPGNHDTFTPGAVASRRFERHFGDLLESDLPEFRTAGPFPFVHLAGEDAAIVGLHSAQRARPPAVAYGRIGSAQLDALAALVEDSRMRHRAIFVAVHHAPLRADGRPDSPIHGLRDARALCAILAGPRFAVLHGHLHSSFHLPADASRPHLFCAGSSTRRGHEGYWLIDADDGRIRGGECIPLPRRSR